MISIDEAIAHAREVEKIQRNNDKLNNTLGESSPYYKTDCLKCAEEHEQLAEWLEELKALRESIYIKCDGLNKALDRGKKIGYNKAIDDFKKILNIEKIKEYAESDGFINLNNCNLMIYDVAEQLKSGDGNE